MGTCRLQMDHAGLCTQGRQHELPSSRDRLQVGIVLAQWALEPDPQWRICSVAHLPAQGRIMTKQKVDTG